MTRYMAARDFSATMASGERIYLLAGQSVELDEAVAEWILRDCPGALVPYKARAAKTKQDRQKKAGANRGNV